MSLFRHSDGTVTDLGNHTAVRGVYDNKGILTFSPSEFIGWFRDAVEYYRTKGSHPSCLVLPGFMEPVLITAMMNSMFPAGKVHELSGKGHLFIDGVKVTFAGSEDLDGEDVSKESNRAHIAWPMFVLDQYPYLDPDHLEENHGEN